MPDNLHSCCQQVLLDHFSECSARHRPSAGAPVVATRITRYEVSCLPESHPDADMFTLLVEYRGEGRWAVTLRGSSFDADGTRSWGPPGDKEPVTDEEIAADNAAHDEWLARHRFDEQTACDLAGRLAPTLQYRGYTVTDALAASPQTTEGEPRHAER